MSDVNYLFFSLKYLFRTIHMISFAFIFGNVSYDLFINKRITTNNPSSQTYINLSISFSILLILSGLTNMILIVIEKKFIKDIHYEVWKKSLIVKFVIAIFLTPLLEALISLGVVGDEKIDSIAIPLKFSFMLILTLASPFLRYYREYFMKTEHESYIK
jgi:hypothetical protein